jgi:hypothetical protein
MSAPMTLAEFFKLCHEGRGLSREVIDEVVELEQEGEENEKERER